MFSLSLTFSFTFFRWVESKGETNGKTSKEKNERIYHIRPMSELTRAQSEICIPFGYLLQKFYIGLPSGNHTFCRHKPIRLMH